MHQPEDQRGAVAPLMRTSTAAPAPGRWPPQGSPSWRAYLGARIAGREARCTTGVTWASRGRSG
eukprot:8493982-Pyramimonas_sp.AAC.1